MQNLAKAVDIGRELARQAAKIEAALADGAPEAFLYGESAYVKPTVGPLTSLFGSRWGRSHQGIDIAGPIGTPIYALTDAVVEEAGPATGYGLWVVLRHTDGTQSVYGHVNRMFVEKGERVDAGEKIAEIGNRGYSTGPAPAPGGLERGRLQDQPVDLDAQARDRVLTVPAPIACPTASVAAPRR